MTDSSPENLPVASPITASPKQSPPRSSQRAPVTPPRPIISAFGCLTTPEKAPNIMHRVAILAGVVWREKKGQPVERFMELSREHLVTYNKAGEDRMLLNAVSCADIEECFAAGGTKWSVRVRDVVYTLDSRQAPSAAEWVKRVSAVAKPEPVEDEGHDAWVEHGDDERALSPEGRWSGRARSIVRVLTGDDGDAGHDAWEEDGDCE